ncbi:MAG: hypothetical protein IJ776_05585 [Paludibacteraceae bacterium]|nr:hypothetical protein [Paludibacteraceae bacterium]
MSGLRDTFRKAAALTAIISAATGLLWAAIVWFNKKAENDTDKNKEEEQQDEEA